MRQYAIRGGAGSDDPVANRILRSPLWPGLRELLQRHGRLEVRTDQRTAGPGGDWFHLVEGGEFLSPSGDILESTRAILEELNVRKST